MNFLEQKAILSILEKDFDLGNITRIENIVAWGGTLRLKINVNNQSYFLKEKVTYLSSNEFKRKTLIHQALSLAGAPVCPIINSNKNFPYSSIGSRLFELLPWLNGRSLKVTSQNLQKLGLTLAKLQIYANNTLTNMLPKNIWHHPQKRQQLFPDKPMYIKKYLKYFYNSKISWAFDRKLLRRILELNAIFLKYIEWDKLEISWIHGDPGIDNTINSQDKILFIDLDNIRVGYRIWDIIQLCSLLGAFKKSGNSIKKLHLEWQEKPIHNLLNGFKSIIKLNPAENRNLPYLIGLKLIMTFIAEFDLDDSYDPTFKNFNTNMNYELSKLICLLENIKSLKII